MTYVEALFLGVLQGLTEFLPVSSSGHLVLAQEVLAKWGGSVPQPGPALEIAVHFGTLVAVVLYYRTVIVRIVRDVFTGGPHARLGWMVVVGTIPAVIVGLTLKDQIEAALDSPVVAGIGLIVTGVFLLLTKAARRGDQEPGFRYATIVGVAQAIAILPGLSRSGATIGTGMFLGDEPTHAAQFSFLLSIPAILGAVVLTVASGDLAATGHTPQLAVACAAAFVSGLGALWFLLRVLAKGRLAVFGPYCIVVGVLALWFVR